MREHGLYRRIAIRQPEGGEAHDERLEGGKLEPAGR